MAAAKLKAAKAGGVTITDEMLALFARGLELQKAGKENFREPGAFECEYLHHVSSPLHRLLGLMPWEIPVLDVKPHTRPEKLPCAYAESFEKVRAIRLALEKAARFRNAVAPRRYVLRRQACLVANGGQNAL